MRRVDLRNPKLWNQKYLTAILLPKIYNILWGGAGSGKSQTMIQFFLSEICNHKVNQNQTYIVIRKVAATIRNSVYQDFKNKVADWSLFGLVQNYDGYMELRSGTNRIIFMGVDNPEKLKSLAQAKYIWVEEATELSREDWIQTTLRLRGKSQFVKRFFLTFNPITDSHWIKELFFDNPAEPDKILAIHSTYRDALQFLDAEYPQRMEALALIDPYYYQVYCLGEWGVLDRNSLFAINFTPDKHVFKGNIKPTKDRDLYLSFDFNITSTCTVAQFTRLHNQPYYGAIFIHKVYRIQDPEVLCATIKAEYPGFNYIINGDASGHHLSPFKSENISSYKLIANLLKLYDDQIQVAAINPTHLASRLVTNIVFKKCIVQISEPNCKDLIIDLKEAKVDSKVSLDTWKKEMDKKDKDRSHSLDSFRYFIYSNFADVVGDFGLEKYEAIVK